MSFADAIELKDHLANILQPVLGEWETGQPRIHIKPPEPSLCASPNPSTGSKLECIVFRNIEGNPTQMSAGQKFLVGNYKVALVNHADDLKLSQAEEILLADSKLIHGRDPVYQPNDGVVLEQKTFYFKTSKIINPVRATT